VGYIITDHDPEYVVLGETDSVDFEQITKAIRLVSQGAHFIATNPDPAGPTEDGIVPAARAMAPLIERASGVSPFFVGKPNPLKRGFNSIIVNLLEHKFCTSPPKTLSGNDLEAGFRQAAALPDPYYVLGFSPQDLKFDGGFHALKVKLVSELRLSVQARRGYFAPKKVEDPSVREKEEIEEAVFSHDESRELPVEVHTQFFVKSNSEVQLAVMAHVDLHPVHFRKQEERNLNNLTFVTALFDRDGHMVTVQERIVQLSLRDATLTAFLKRGLTVTTHFDIKPGTYLVRTVVRDSESGQISGLNHTVEIPF
jgi:hypothetical protein